MVTHAGYSGTPLAKKLGLKEGFTISLVDAPPELRAWLAPLPPRLRFVAEPAPGVDLVHAFFTERAELKRRLAVWRRTLGDAVVLWISWPKKNPKLSAGAAAGATVAKIDSDISEDVIRELALPLGFVDVKVCAVNEVWSGLKLVVRKEHRASASRKAAW